MPKTVYGRSECGLTNEEDELLVDLSENWGTNVSIAAFPEEMQTAICKRIEESEEDMDFYIDVMDF